MIDFERSEGCKIAAAASEKSREIQILLQFYHYFNTSFICHHATWRAEEKVVSLAGT